jgi:Xaa-Pro aminopeptidase
LDIYYESARVIVEGLKGMGLMKGSTNDALEQGAHALFFPCGLGHLMGLDVHDMEDLGEEIVGYGGAKKSTQFGVKSLRLGRKLEPGFVLTIEPGIYFIPQLIDLWKGENRHREFIDYNTLEKFRSFGGIRNEENFLITPDGYQLLGKAKPKSIEEVETITAT